MRTTIGTLIGVIIISLGLAGLGVAMAQMMTYANPHAALIAIGGLATFAVSAIIMLALAR